MESGLFLPIHIILIAFKDNYSTYKMGRTIPSCKQLLEIEKLDWPSYKKLLPLKKDKQAFDEIFEKAKLHTSYLSNAVNPIIFESVIMGSLFHNYKTLLDIDKNVTVFIYEQH